MAKKLLTIAIPTFNRAAQLKVTLENLLSQIQNRNDTQIFVSDNCSADDTVEILKGFKELYPDKLMYKQNKENIGFGKNLESMVDIVDSTYIWFCGDDDIYKEHSIEKINNVLSTNDVDFCFVNYYVYPEGNSYDALTDKIFNKQQFLRETKGGTYFVGSCIFKTNRIKNTTTSSYVWYHYDKIINLSPESKMYVIVEPLIEGIRPKENNWWKGFVIEFSFSHELLIAVLVSILPKEEKRIFLKRHLEDYVSKLFKAKKEIKNNIAQEIDFAKYKKELIEANDKQFNLFLEEFMLTAPLSYLLYKIIKIIRRFYAKID